MGALHEGHLAHVTAAREHADRVVVSIFVNPTQFGPDEDFERYPRTLEEDLQRCAKAGVDGVFVPSVEQMYPPGGFAVDLDVPGLTDQLEGEHRPGHFQGVCRVVMKLFNLVRPDVATFGRKDYQQARVIEAMGADLMMPVDLVHVPTVREADGLAVSSRNRYLSQEQRWSALGLPKALRDAEVMVTAGELAPEPIEGAMRQVMASRRLQVDYAVVRHPRTLAPLDCIEPEVTGGVVALVAGRVGGVRLLDNLLIAEPGQA